MAKSRHSLTKKGFQPPADKDWWRVDLKRRLSEHSAPRDVAARLGGGILQFLDFPKDRHGNCADNSTVMVYASMPHEAPTGGVMWELWNLGLRVAFPVVKPENSITPYWITNRNELVADRFGIAAPHPDTQNKSRRVELSDLKIVVIPGLGFDADTGVRLGRGGGYYDRFLARCPKALRIGLAFDEQIVCGLPAEPHDVPMHAVVTPTRTLRFDPPK